MVGKRNYNRELVGQNRLSEIEQFSLHSIL